MWRKLNKFIFLSVLFSLLAGLAEARPSIEILIPTIIPQLTSPLSAYEGDVKCDGDDRLEHFQIQTDLSEALQAGGVKVSKQGKYLLKTTIESSLCASSGFTSDVAYFFFGLITVTRDSSFAQMTISTEVVNKRTSETISLREFYAKAPISNNSYIVFPYQSDDIRVKTSLESMWAALLSKIVVGVREDLK